MREEQVIPLEEAVRKLTSLPASNLKIARRGRLAPGYYADVVAFLHRDAQLKEQGRLVKENDSASLVDLGDGVRMKLVSIPAGEFSMGSNDETPLERPVTRLKIRVLEAAFSSVTSIG